MRLVLDLGEQHLGGQFPAADEPDPPAHPLRLARCTGCGLVQLDRTVPLAEMFTNYGYRSGITATMTSHLRSLAAEAVGMAKPREWPTVLDIGCNDFTLLNAAPPGWRRTGVDGCDVAVRAHGPYGAALIHGFFPQACPGGQFDLILSVAMFYDADDPVAFAKAVRDHLASDGLWCVEVADLGAMLRNTAYDQICHEHLCYYEPQTMMEVAKRAGLSLVRKSFNQCNGGSRRYYFCRDDCKDYTLHFGEPPRVTVYQLNEFAAAVRFMETELRCLLQEYAVDHTIHVLGASTKLNTVLQYCDLGRFIDAASDRDPRKVGRRTPGSNIPIVSEEESRAMKPDAYLVGPWHFREELIERERAAGTTAKLIFPLPNLEVYDLIQEDVPCLSH